MGTMAWSRTDPFKDKRHVSGRVELAIFLVVSNGENPVGIAPLGFMMAGRGPRTAVSGKKGDWRSPAQLDYNLGFFRCVTKALFSLPVPGLVHRENHRVST